MRSSFLARFFLTAVLLSSVSFCCLAKLKGIEAGDLGEKNAKEIENSTSNQGGDKKSTYDSSSEGDSQDSNTFLMDSSSQDDYGLNREDNHASLTYTDSSTVGIKTIGEIAESYRRHLKDNAHKRAGARAAKRYDDTSDDEELVSNASTNRPIGEIAESYRRHLKDNSHKRAGARAAKRYDDTLDDKELGLENYEPEINVGSEEEKSKVTYSLKEQNESASKIAINYRKHLAHLKNKHHESTRSWDKNLKIQLIQTENFDNTMDFIKRWALPSFTDISTLVDDDGHNASTFTGTISEGSGGSSTAELFLIRDSKKNLVFIVKEISDEKAVNLTTHQLCRRWLRDVVECLCEGILSRG